MNLTDYTTKTPTTWGQIRPSDILDDYQITRVQNRNGLTRAYFYGGGGWSPWTPSTRPVSVYR